MTTTPEHDERIIKMTFASVYPHYITKVEKKGRTSRITPSHYLVNRF
nr:DUF2200 family protein [Winogradskyella helgolandensis]